MRTSLPEGESGATLVIVLAFISIFGLILAGLLTESSVSLGFTSAVNTNEAKVYAADAGVSLGIQQLRQNSDICPSASEPGTPIPDLAIPKVGATAAQAVGVTCETADGSALGGLGQAVITTSTDGTNSLHLSGASSTTIELGGPVFVNGGATYGGSNPALKVSGGDFRLKLGCAAATDPTTPPNQKLCVPIGQPVPDPPHVAPSSVPTLEPNTAGYPAGSCQVFHPGLYKSHPILVGGDNYFASGVYYFNFSDPADVFNVAGARVFGGQPTDFDKANQQLGTQFTDGRTFGTTKFTSASATFKLADVGRRIFTTDGAKIFNDGTTLRSSTTIASFSDSSTVSLSLPAATASGIGFGVGRPPACGSDPATGAAADPIGVEGVNGKGVEFVFGGKSRMYVDTQGNVELFGRLGDPVSTAGTENISVVGVPGDWTGWTANTANASGKNLIEIKPGDPQNFITHGVIYAPTQDLSLRATNSVIAQALNGIVASTLLLTESGSGNGLGVSLPVGAPHPRKIKITATTKTPGGQPALSVAVVDVGNDATRTITVESWRTRGVADSQ